MKSKQKTTINEAAELLRGANSIALFAHTNPDGDAIGACLGLKLVLQKLGKNVAVFCDSDMNDKMSAFEETRCVRKIFGGKYDLLVAVDCGDVFRLGEFCGLYDRFSETLTIDHHGGEYFSKYNCLYDYASSCQIVYEIARVLNAEFDENIATCLYMGLCTDTGNFAHSNTDSDSFYMAGDLCKYGADVQKVYRIFFRDTTLAETKLQAKAVARMRSYYDNRMFLIYITQADLNEFGLDASVTSGIVSSAINIDTAKVGVCMTEFAENDYKVSMRGKDFSVRDVCKEFGGGGHVLAAGCKISGLLEDVIEKIVRVVGYTL
ncbi:MAG: bifunctional oligoribonuclease/PAP phosphatase NrnA [Firmicutes bacterium]|nr:bifunctional oligoribonuclease/PAP phosphatase NrnA [Bacillota bacterium]